MMIHTRPNGTSSELARHLDKARDRSFKHQMTELRSGGGRVAANAFFGEAAPPILPTIRARLGVIPVEVFQFELPDVARGFLHLHEFGIAVQHHGSLVFTGMGYTSPTAFAIGIEYIFYQCR